MIIPGLDRLEGTAVSPDLLNSDQLWNEHTTEILELLEQENTGKAPEDTISMVQFCAAYANGNKTTMAMRRAKVRQDWKVDQLALKMQSEEQKAKKPSFNPQTESLSRRSRQRGKPTNYVSRNGTKKHSATVPGIVFAAGAAFPYRETNIQIRSCLKRVREILNMDGFYCMAEHSCHITIATLQKYRDAEFDKTRPEKVLDIDEATSRLVGSPAIQAEVAKGPITLIADRLEIPGDGDAVVLLFTDKESRFEKLREAVRTVLGIDAPDIRIPTFIHTSIARVVESPSCSRAVMLQKLQGIVEAIEVEVDTLDLVLEDRDPYFSLFPDGAVAHWDLLTPVHVETTTEPRVDKHESAIAINTGLPERASKPWTLPGALVRFLERDDFLLFPLGIAMLSTVALWS